MHFLIFEILVFAVFLCLLFFLPTPSLPSTPVNPVAAAGAAVREQQRRPTKHYFKVIWIHFVPIFWYVCYTCTRSTRRFTFRYILFGILCRYFIYILYKHAFDI